MRTVYRIEIRTPGTNRWNLARDVKGEILEYPEPKPMKIACEYFEGLGYQTYTRAYEKSV